MTEVKEWSGSALVAISDANENGFIDASEYFAGSLTKNPFLFQGQRLDQESGLYYFKNRYYDSATGRFITRDPIGFVDGPNLYTFVNNSPINFLDPTGEYERESIAPNEEAILAKLYEKYKGTHAFGTWIEAKQMGWHVWIWPGRAGYSWTSAASGRIYVTSGSRDIEDQVEELHDALVRDDSEIRMAHATWTARQQGSDITFRTPELSASETLGVVADALPGALGKGAVVVGNEMSFGLAEKVIPGVKEIREDWQSKATPGQILFVQITGRAATVCFTAAAAIAAGPAVFKTATDVVLVYGGLAYVVATQTPVGHFVVGLAQGFGYGYIGEPMPPSIPGPHETGVKMGYWLGKLFSGALR